MSDIEKPKRPRGNPNFIKKQVEETPKVDSNSKPAPEGMSLYDQNAWLQIFCAVLGTYNAPGSAAVKQAATHADEGLIEFNKRVNK